MDYQSPMKSLMEVLIRVVESSKAAKTDRHEAWTRVALIDPVLRCLGWNIDNSGMVQVEKATPSGKSTLKADYVLLDRDENNAIVIEAKALGTNLDSFAAGALEYSGALKAGILILTDGLTWQHYSKLESVSDIKPNRKVKLDVDDVKVCARYFLENIDAALFWGLSDSSSDLSQKVADLESQLSSLSHQFSLLAAKGGESSTAVQASELSTEFSKDFVRLSELSEVTGKKPGRLRLPDGTILHINSWKDVLREACKFALKSNPNIQIPFQDRAGATRNLLDTKKPPLGIAYATEDYNGQTIYICTNYSAAVSIGNAIHVLGQIPGEVVPMAVELKLD